MDNKYFVTGCTGMDGAILCELLLSRGNSVVGMKRRSSVDNQWRIKHLLNHTNFIVVEGDTTDPISINNILSYYKPQYIINTAAQSHVHTSFEQPAHTFDVNTNGVLYILEAMRHILPNSRMVQCSTSEMFGRNVDNNGYQSETTQFMPQSPYAISKLAAHHLVELYRDSYGLHASASVCFNHEGPTRGELFVTRKITMYVASLAINRFSDYLYLGNLNAHRDWGHCKDYMECLLLMLQQEKPDDYVVATGVTKTVREFCEMAFSYVGENYSKYVKIDPKLLRPAEVEFLRGDATRAKHVLGWEPKISFKELVHEMVDADIDRAKREIHNS